MSLRPTLSLPLARGPLLAILLALAVHPPDSPHPAVQAPSASLASSGAPATGAGLSPDRFPPLAGVLRAAWTVPNLRHFVDLPWPHRLRAPWFQIGEASYYGPDFAGKPTASGRPFDPQALVAAHRSLPLGTRLRVTNLANGRQVLVRVVDRGPFTAGRMIDLSERAAGLLGLLVAGVGRVAIEVVSLPGIAAGRPAGAAGE